MGTVLNNYLALTIYEYAITLPQEVNTVWQRKWTIASVLLISTRWILLAMAITRLLLPTVSLMLSTSDSWLITLNTEVDVVEIMSGKSMTSPTA